jgi:hypothetical protein
MQCKLSVLSGVEEKTGQGQLKVEKFHKEILGVQKFTCIRIISQF